MKPNISVDASPRYLVGPSAAAGLVLVIFFFVLTRVSSVLSGLAFVLLSLAVLAGLGAEIALWQKHGTRRIEVNGKTLTLYRGRNLVQVRIDRGDIVRTRARSGLGLRRLTLSLVTGQRVRLSGQAFPEEAFSQFLAAMADW